MSPMVAPVLESQGFVFEHHGQAYDVPAFELAAGAVLGLQFPRGVAEDGADIASSAHDGGDDGAPDDLGDTLLGLAPIVSGRALLFGADVARTSRTDLIALRRRVAFAPLRPAFLSTVTVPDNVAIPLRDREDPPDDELMGAVHAKLAQLYVPITGRVLPGQLAPRARYLAGIARALLAPSDLLLVAVPELALARHQALTIRAELDRARERGAALLLLGRSRLAALSELTEVHPIRPLTTPEARPEGSPQ